MNRIIIRRIQLSCFRWLTKTWNKSQQSINRKISKQHNIEQAYVIITGRVEKNKFGRKRNA